MTKIATASIRRFLDAPDKNLRAVLLYGPNQSFVHEAAQKIARWALKKDADDPYAITKLGEDEIKKDNARLGDALAAQSMFGGSTLVWARIDGKGADASLLHALGEIERDEPRAFLVIEGGDLSGSSELVKAFNNAKNAACAAFYEESDAERGIFAKALASELGVAFEQGAQEDFLTALPADRGMARKEIEKLALYAHGLGRKLSSDDLAQLLTDEGESALDAASLAAASGKPAQAIEALARIDSLSGVSALRALERRMLQLNEARAQMDQGASASDAIAKLRPPVFWKERDVVANQARMWTGKKLSAAFDILWAAELRAKTAGSPQDLVAADAFRSVAKLVSN